MFSEPLGWLALAVAVVQLIVGVIQVWQGKTPRGRCKHTQVERTRTLKVLGVSYTSRRIETRDSN